MGRLVQQPPPAGADRKHSASRAEQQLYAVLDESALAASFKPNGLRQTRRGSICRCCRQFLFPSGLDLWSSQLQLLLRFIELLANPGMTFDEKDREIQ